MKFRWINLLMLVSGLTLLLAGCAKFKHSLVVMPDGSGKMVFEFGVNEDVVDTKTVSITRYDPLEENQQGIVAYSRSTITRDGTWTFITYTYYFDDINRVEMGSERLYKFEKGEDRYTLTSNNPVTATKGKEVAELVDSAFMRKAHALEGARIEEHYELPGKVTSIRKPGTIEGRKASVVMTAEDMVDKEKGRLFAEDMPRTIKCGPSEVSDDDMAAWKKELAEAKDEWAKYKKELEAQRDAKVQQ